MPDKRSEPDIHHLRRRLELLEAENQRLREKLEPMLGPDNPAFDPRQFQRILRRSTLWILLPVYALTALIVLLPMPRIRQYLPAGDILGVKIVDVMGIGTRHPGMGVGVIAFGGVGFGVLGIGGLGVGAIAIGGGAIGLIALGGGSIGLIAIGGGACGVIAVGGSASGYYALGQRGYGKYVLALNRQDDQAIEFFLRHLPRLRPAVTRPMPVIPLSDKPSAA